MKFEVLAQTHSLYSALAHLKGDDQAALGHAHHAVEVAEKIGSAFSRVLAYHARGQARMLRGESTAAVDALERALAIGRDRPPHRRVSRSARKDRGGPRSCCSSGRRSRENDLESAVMRLVRQGLRAEANGRR